MSPVTFSHHAASLVGEGERGARWRRCGEGEGCGRALPGDTRRTIKDHPALLGCAMQEPLVGLLFVRDSQKISATRRKEWREKLEKFLRWDGL